MFSDLILFELLKIDYISDGLLQYLKLSQTLCITHQNLTDDVVFDNFPQQQ